MLGLKLIHVSESGPCGWMNTFNLEMIFIKLCEIRDEATSIYLDPSRWSSIT